MLTIDGITLEYRGIKAIWSNVYKCFRFAFRTAGRQEIYGVPNEREFQRTVDQLFARERWGNE